jgi:YgiT-type zinc finger domain-containing protein
VKCVICKHGETRPGKITVTLHRGDMILVMKGVPAGVCEKCGEEYLDAGTKDRMMHQAEEFARSGMEVAICEYLGSLEKAEY